MSAGGEISSFGDSLFDVMKAQQEATHAAYNAGDSAGYARGFNDGLRRAAQIIESNMGADAAKEGAA